MVVFPKEMALCMYCFDSIIYCSSEIREYLKISNIIFVTSQLTQRRCDNVVISSGTVENESCTDVRFRRCDSVALRHFQDVGTTLLKRRHNINHWITRPFYYGLF